MKSKDQKRAEAIERAETLYHGRFHHEHFYDKYPTMADYTDQFRRKKDRPEVSS